MSNPSNTAPPPRSGGLSLYANLLDPTATTAVSISKGPVVFNKTGATETSEETSAKKHQIDAATLRFQPTKRPQLSQKPKPKTGFPKPAPSDNTAKSNPSAPLPSLTRPAFKSTLADWTATGDGDDVNGFYAGEKRQRGGRKRRKKNKEEYAIAQDWDDIYDPTRPNSYEEYKHSDEKIREVTEWKDRLYAHRKARKPPSDSDSDEEDYRPQMGSKSTTLEQSNQEKYADYLDQFAPPSSYSFAPPPMDSPPLNLAPGENVELDQYSSTKSANTISPPIPPEASSQETFPAGAISRAPVRYNLPAAPSDIPKSEQELEEALAEDIREDDEQTPEDEPRSLRPGQKGFAERLMSKYGWSKGKGLGADGSGIVNPLRVQIEKRKKKSDAEGGGFRDPGGRGKIIGGKKNLPEKDAEVGKFGSMSEVIILRGMVDGMDLDEEVEGAGDGGLMQEIGDECAEKYGRVERVYIDRHGAAPAKVFVKFTSQLSALRAVNALEGRIFNGNTISALFYDTEKFEQGIFE